MAIQLGIGFGCLTPFPARHGPHFLRDHFEPTRPAVRRALSKGESYIKHIGSEGVGAATKMGIDVWEVIEAAKTKPFGFTPFYPGPGLGGHCIPLDPFYLSWKAAEYGV